MYSRRAGAVVWNLSFSHPLNDWEVGDFASLLTLLESVVVTESVRDRRVWASNSSGRFYVKAYLEEANPGGIVAFPTQLEPLSALAAEYQSGSRLARKNKGLFLCVSVHVLGEEYAAIRRTRGDGNCFFRSFMFSYLEHILDSQDKAEVDRITAHVEQCKKTLQSLGYADFTFEDFFALFLEQLESVLQGSGNSISHDELVTRSRDQSTTDYVVMFFRFVTSGEIRRRSEFFEPFIMGLTNSTVEQFCKSAVEPMGEESDHVHIIALSDALGVPIRVLYLDRSSCDTGGVSVNHHDFIPASGDPHNAAGGSSDTINPIITLLYRPGHYDILYPK
ncbi:hypothetical protein HHK36_029404 [Tetracentron sinense]|uniref:ubiquitinyl hydrolase 1 n=1 Tax=Tetracentron sinense TaxID=13715 RepID=A0A834YES5_TETSI|nr:hypothetical protein HHK36_029404 [Tetracentron sinense]